MATRMVESIRRDETQEMLAYIIAKLVLFEGCPRCGFIKVHDKDCALDKIVRKFEMKLRSLPDTAFD